MGQTFYIDGATVKADTINLGDVCAEMVKAKVSIIVATALDGAIGRGGAMPWHIPGDLKRFKALTTGHPVIMGHNTWKSLPIKPLPKRRNIVVSRDPELVIPGAEVAHSIQEAITLCSSENEMFIIGGAQIYASAIPLCRRLYLTAVLDVFPDADTFFPELNPKQWRMTWTSPVEETQEGLQYQYLNYERI